MKIYIDSEFKCHTANTDGTFKEVETSFFDSKCDAFIEGYRFIPAGDSWKNAEGWIFRGEMVAPWKPYLELASAQTQYEADMAAMKAAEEELKDMRNALSILEVELDG